MKAINIVIPALLGLGVLGSTTMTTEAAQVSKLHEYKQNVVVTSNTKLYRDYHLKSSSNTQKGTVYKANGYYLINGQKYYRVYQSKFKGYVAANKTKTLKAQTVNKSYHVSKRDPYNQWTNLYFDNHRGPIALNQVVYVKYAYNLPNGCRYYSVYDQDNRNQWLGYVNANAFSLLQAKSVNKYVNLVEDNPIYSSLNGKPVRGNTSSYKNQYVMAKYRYDFTARSVYSVYAQDGKWIGYVESFNVKSTVTPRQLSMMNSYVMKSLELQRNATKEELQSRPYQLLITATRNAERHSHLDTTVDEWFKASMQLSGRIANVINMK